MWSEEEEDTSDDFQTLGSGNQVKSLVIYQEVSEEEDQVWQQWRENFKSSLGHRDSICLGNRLLETCTRPWNASLEVEPLETAVMGAEFTGR